MDDVDLDVLEELRRDAKASLKTLARKFGIPLSTLYQRIKKLEENGFIKNYTINIDWEKLGYKIKAYVLVYVDTTKLRELRKPQKEILDQAKKLPYVFDAEITTGDCDLIMMVRAKDTEHLGKILIEDIQGITGITQTKSLVSISTL
ncbi:MAG: Lrp/AsnC family transcriptional regulator [Candidatus Micrarchaeota archaeon]